MLCFDIILTSSGNMQTLQFIVHQQKVSETVSLMSLQISKVITSNSCDSIKVSVKYEIKRYIL